MTQANTARRPDRVLSGMRPTGRMHLGNYHGALKNWVDLQTQYDCYFFVADWHALTTAYDETQTIEDFSREMVVDWLGAGLSPEHATIFVQSKVPEHAELHLFLSMITPLSWVERVPTYKEMIDSLESKDLATYGFLGYPVLQAADILMYRAERVPVGMDQAPHVEMSREIARRFNDIFGRGADFESQVMATLDSQGGEFKKAFLHCHRRYREGGDAEALRQGLAMLGGLESVAQEYVERLEGYLRGTGRVILPEPQTLVTETPRVVGLDGRKMSKSYGNTIQLRDSPEVIERKVARMQTDPARVRLKDPGDPAKCPVYAWHEIYLDEEQRQWAAEGCRTASIGCRDCKQPLIDALSAERTEFIERATPYAENPAEVERVLAAGSEKARVIAKETMHDVRSAIGLIHG
ncbi:MAG: tryptophan--tRNA ligase [Gammaproteobacteria bacterium]|nr:tryptophan--tRNA ligase [Gammaproteobacteria bacterium]